MGTDSKVYRFKNRVEIIDLGLRLTDVERLSLIAEPVKIDGDWEAHAATLKRHGAMQAEINFLATERVELNMMTAPVFVSFLEDKFAEHGIKKVIPKAEVLEAHARRIIEQDLAKAALKKIQAKLKKEAAAAKLPADLSKQVRDLLMKKPALSWDMATASIIRGD